MIGINWYEVYLPTTVFDISFEHYEPGVSSSERKRSIGHKTVLKTIHTHKKDEKVIYHITQHVPETAEIGKIDFDDDPSIGKYAIEKGFSQRLQENEFKVLQRHVGGVGYRDVSNSARPGIYQASEGISFRCFYGFEQEEPKYHYRWGLILSFITSQYFLISLEDDILRSIAIGKRVVKMRNYRNSEKTKISGILESTSGTDGILISNKGEKIQISLREWTLPCGYNTLINYLRRFEGSKGASEVSIKLQQDALTLTSEKRMNTALAKDQLVKLQTLIMNNGLSSFSLALPGKTMVRLNLEPLRL